MVESDNPQPFKLFEEGHGIGSTIDERKGGVAGAVLGGLAGYSRGGSRDALVGAVCGWIVGEEVVDIDKGPNMSK